MTYYVQFNQRIERSVIHSSYGEGKCTVLERRGQDEDAEKWWGEPLSDCAEAVVSAQLHQYRWCQYCFPPERALYRVMSPRN